MSRSTRLSSGRLFIIEWMVSASTLERTQQRPIDTAGLKGRNAQSRGACAAHHMPRRHFRRGEPRVFLPVRLSRLFVSPWDLFVTTAALRIAMWRRQFASNASTAIGAQEEKSCGVNKRSITFHSP